MGQGLGEGVYFKMDHSVTLSQINNMKHAIGFEKDKVTGRKYRKYEAYRNYYATNENCDGFSRLVDLVDKGLMSMRQNGTDGWFFHVTKRGFEFLSDITGVTITESEVD